MTKPVELRLPEIEKSDAMTTQDYVYRRLHNAIMVGAIPPATSLTFRGLAASLDLSPTPVREAIRRLSSEHAVEVQGNRRLVIPEMTAGRFEELVQLRIALEVHAAERSLPYVSDIVIEKMKALDDEMDQMVKDKSFDRLTCLNYEFHSILYTLNPDQAVMPLIQSVWLQLGPFQRQVVNDLESFYFVDRHKEILTALRSRDLAALVVGIESDIRDGMAREGRRLLLKQPRNSAAS